MAALSQQEVENRLHSYDSNSVTDVLYDMGKTLMDECGQRIDYLDAKSARIAGYIGAIVGLMLSTFPIWTAAIDRWAVYVAAAGVSIGIVGAAAVLRSMSPAKLLLPSDSDWLELDGLKDSDRLKKYYISSMHLLIASQEKVGARKVLAIKLSQRCLTLMALSLLIVFGNATYKIATRSSQPPSDHAALAVVYVPQEAF
jgi:hypothetical protein